jgi:hypothetical protein
MYTKKSTDAVYEGFAICDLIKRGFTAYPHKKGKTPKK